MVSRCRYGSPVGDGVPICSDKDTCRLVYQVGSWASARAPSSLTPKPDVSNIRGPGSTLQVNYKLLSSSTLILIL